MNNVLKILLTIFLSLTTVFPNMTTAEEYESEGNLEEITENDEEITSEAREVDDSAELEVIENSHLESFSEDVDLEEGETAELVNDGRSGSTSIDSFEIQFVSGAQKDDLDRLVWTANRSTNGHGFIFRVNYSTSGIDKTEPEDLEIRIPLHILRNRAGEYADHCEMSVPHVDELTEEDTNEYAYRIENDEIVFFNVKEISAAVNGYFEVQYSMSEKTFEYEDMGVSDDFHASMSVNNLTAESSRIPVYINTSAEIVSIDKRYPTLYQAWEPEWGEKPADADDYFYLIWEFRTRTIEDLTQPYKLEFTDDITSAEGYSLEDEDYIQVPEITKDLIEIVGFKMSGEKEFSQNNEISRSTISGYRYDYVLTRHPKSDFDPLDRYNITNHVHAELTPLDLIDPPTTAESSKKFAWERPEFHYPTGHFEAFKRADGIYRANGKTYLSELGMIAGKYSRYDLQELKEENVEYLEDFDYAVWMDGFPYPWTLEEGANPLDPTKYGVVPVEFELIDEGVYLYEDGGVINTTRPLTSDDFQIDYINWGIQLKDAEVDSNTLAFQSIPVTKTDNDIITVYLKFGENSSSFVEAGTYNLKTGTANFDRNYIDSFTDKTIVPSENCVAYKLVAKNSHFYTQIRSVPNMRLKGSSYVLEMIQDWDSVAIRNVMQAYVYDAQRNVLFNTSEEETDYARVTQKDSSIRKDVVGATNNKKKRYYSISWMVSQKELATYGQGDQDYIEQQGGVFYDLIPTGQNVVIDSIAVQTNEGWLPENSYSVYIANNWKGSGRTLLKVRVKDTFDYAKLFFDTRIDWETIKDFGTYVFNPVAYQTGNKNIAQGFPDDGGELRKDIEYMSGLDAADAESGYEGNNGANRFIYASEHYDIAAITQATAGLTKHVKAAEDSEYSYDTWTSPNGDYSYRWRYMNTFNTRTKNMIFFDSLENYRVDPGTPEEDVSDWHGTLQSIDTTLLKQFGIDYHIYISDVTDLNIDNNHDLTDISVWREVNENDDLSSAKAIAVDISKKTDGSDFVLMEGESVQIVLNMKAPPQATSEKQRIPVSYNNVYISDTVIDSYDNEQDFFIRHDYTAIRLLVTGNINVHKVSSEDGITPIRNIKFRLRGTSDYGNEFDKFAVSDRMGDLIFKKIEMGTYILSEYEGTADWIEDHTEHTVVIDPFGKVWIDGADYTEASITIQNDPRIHTDITLLKKEKNTGLVFEEDEWDPETMTKYAVALLGIKHDIDENGNLMGLTFGPATGADYTKSYHSHTPTGTTTKGFPHRCIHEDSWEEIVYWNFVDPYVYEQCIEEGCTHSVNLTVGNLPIFTGEKLSTNGDGPSILDEELQSNARRWNTKGIQYGGTGNVKYVSEGGWGASNVRAVLNGVDYLTTSGNYASTQNITEEKALISAFPKVLQETIGRKAVKYDSVYNAQTVENLKTTYDKLWLLSTNEMGDNESIGWPDARHPLESQRVYERYENNKISSGADPFYQGYYVRNISADTEGQEVRSGVYWLRSLRGIHDESANYVHPDGFVDGTVTGYDAGISPCFTLSGNLSDLDVASSDNQDGPSWIDYIDAQSAQNAFPSLNGVIPNTTFKLEGTSDYGNDVVMIETTGLNGRLTFKDVEQGTYTVTEIKESEGYIRDETKYTITIDENGLVSSDRLVSQKLYYELENEPRYWNFNLRKVDAEDKNIWLQGATIHISGISDLGTAYDMTITSDANGKIEVKELEKGTYAFEEISAPTGVDAQGHTGTGGTRNYLTDPTQRILTVDGNGIVKIDGLEKGHTGEIFIPNERALDGKITVYKHWVYIPGEELPTPQITISTTDPETEPIYVVTYDANGGHFSDNTSINQVYYKREGSLNFKVEGDVEDALPSEEGVSFLGWYLDKAGTQPFESSTYDLTGNITVYAKWKDWRMRYAVALYDIGKDIDENGNTMGLTFGPATGADYINSYHSHMPTGITALGNPHRCLHDDTWEEIVYWNSVDSYVYEQCITEGCTHSLILNIPNEIGLSYPLYANYSGDGPSILNTEIQQNAKKWNAWGSSNGGSGTNGTNTNGGWGVSNIRAILNGVDNDNSDGIVTTADTFAVAKGITESTALIAAFPVILQESIGRKAVKYDGIYNSKTEENLRVTYDKLWLLSSYEMGDASSISETAENYRHPLESDFVYERFKNRKVSRTANSFYIGYSAGNLSSPTATSTSSATNWYTRSVLNNTSIISGTVDGNLGLSFTDTYYGYGFFPCFSLSRY